MKVASSSRIFEFVGFYTLFFALLIPAVSTKHVTSRSTASFVRPPDGNGTSTYMRNQASASSTKNVVRPQVRRVESQKNNFERTQKRSRGSVVPRDSNTRLNMATSSRLLASSVVGGADTGRFKLKECEKKKERIGERYQIVRYGPNATPVIKSGTLILEDGYDYEISRAFDSPDDFAGKTKAGASVIASRLWEKCACTTAVLSKKVAGSLSGIKALDARLFCTYFCGAVVMNTPTVLLPLIATDPSVRAAAAAAGSTSAVSGASFAAAVASVATMGGAVGKFVNGFVCQSAGGRRSATTYLSGLAAAMFAFSLSTSFHGIAFSTTSMEFFNSILWTACLSVLASHYESDAVSFAQGVTTVSLASTAGALTTKVGFSFLLKYLHWRTVARIASGFALLGVGVVYSSIHDSKDKKHDPQGGDISVKGILTSVREVAGNRLFWIVGVAHAMAFVTRSSDRVLGTFYQEVAKVPRHLCGGLTSSVTIGFVHGLVTGRKFAGMESLQEKRKFLTSRYASTVVSALVLAMCAVSSMTGVISGWPLAAIAALTSGVMASAISFQFYQLPPAFAKKCGNNKDVCLSFLDGMGYLMSAPIWALTGKMVAGGVRGWSMAWASLALWFSFGAVLMMGAMPKFVEWKKEHAG